MNITLYTEDIVFGNMLFEYVNSNYMGRIAFSLITDEKYLNAGLEKNPPIILLIDSNNVDTSTLCHKYKILKIVSQQTSDPLMIYKYQLADGIITKIVEVADVNIPSNAMTTNDCKIITSYSPQGGIGVTSTTIDICKQLITTGNKVLYLSLEDIDSTGYYFKVQSDCFKDMLRLDDILDNKHLSITIDQYIGTDPGTGISYLRYPIASQYIYDIDYDRFIIILNILINTGKFNYIVLDLASNVGKRNIKLMRKAHKVLLLENPNDELCRHKLSRFYDEINIISNRFEVDIKSKIINLNINDLKNRNADDHKSYLTDIMNKL